MPKRISWKKGMRLTAEILKASDKCTDRIISHCLSLAASGRFGLIPSNRPFNISLNFNKNHVEIEELDCLAITKSGTLIDISFDTRYSNAMETRLSLPASEDDVLLLTVSESKDSWKETNDGFIEPTYIFQLISNTSPLSPDSLPIARIVREVSGWQVDNIDFVPPCLFITSLRDYEALNVSFLNILNASEKYLFNSLHSSCTTAIGILWPAVQQLKITLDKERDIMTPMVLLGHVQKYVSAFACACMLEPILELKNYDQYSYFINTPYDYKNVYGKIKEGLELCQEINSKVMNFKDIVIEVVKPEPKPEPRPEPKPKPEPKPAPMLRRGWDGLEI